MRIQLLRTDKIFVAQLMWYIKNKVVCGKDIYVRDAFVWTSVFVLRVSDKRKKIIKKNGK